MTDHAEKLELIKAYSETRGLKDVSFRNEGAFGWIMFGTGKNANGGQLVWDVVRECGVSWGCGSVGQHQIEPWRFVQPASPPIFRFDEVPVQKGCRWFVRRSGETRIDCGFRSKTEANHWINGFGSRLDWRAGFVFRLKGDEADIEIVDKKGILSKP